MRWMNMNGCLATLSLNRFVYKSNTALLLTWRANGVSATINQTYLHCDTAAQRGSRKYEKITVCTLRCLHNNVAHFLICLSFVIITILWFVYKQSQILFQLNNSTALNTWACKYFASAPENRGITGEWKETVTMTTWVWIYAVRWQGRRGCHGCTMNGLSRETDVNKPSYIYKVRLTETGYLTEQNPLQGLTVKNIKLWKNCH